MSPTDPTKPDEGRSPSGAALVVSGGDGAIFYLLQTLQPPYPNLAIRPAGRGNALARDLRAIPANAARPVAIDLMEVEIEPVEGEPYTRLCASSVSFGFPTTVTRTSLRFRTLRRLSYAAACCVTIPQQQFFKIQYDGGMFETKTLTGVLINNTRHVGGFVAFPHGSCHDGHVEAMELRSGYLGQIAHNLSSMSRADLYTPARITPITQAAVRPERPQELMLDGELIPAVKAVHLRVRPAAIGCYFLEP
ncbi:MAG TPA: diacylglycerol kinase family protein [Paludibaculum sp.]